MGAIGAQVTENSKIPQPTDSSRPTVARNESFIKDPLLSVSTEAAAKAENVTQVPLSSSTNTATWDASSSEPVARSQN